MFMQSFFEPTLAHYAYLVGCQSSGEAIVIDPGQDIERYLRAAQIEGLHIVAAAETHIHADLLSGCRLLAERAGATLYLSAEGGAAWQYRYAAAYPHRLLRDGDCVPLGRLRLQALHTPGHTPEHLSFLLTDGAATSLPMGIFSGDCVFVGDVGRPDLLETALGVAGVKDAAARQLFQSVQRFAELPDFLQLWPAHGAGSACGKALGAVPSSTIGYERRVNWAFQAADEATFVEAVLTGQPPPPRYFAMMKRLNQDGPPLRHADARPPSLGVAEVSAAQQGGTTIVDVRSHPVYASGHLPGAINIPLSSRSFVSYAGSVLDYGANLALVCEPSDVMLAIDALARIGLTQVVGWTAPETVDAWAGETGRPTATLPQVTVAEVAEQVRRGELEVIDVREADEFARGHLPHARNVPLGTIPGSITILPADRPLVIQCQSGVRSGIAASLLAARGHRCVSNLVGGYLAWRAAGLPTFAA